MRIITGDECGLLKEVLPETQDVRRLQSTGCPSPNQNNHEQGPPEMSRSKGVVGLAFCPNSKPESYAFCALRLDGTVERWEGYTRGIRDNSPAHYIQTHSWNHVLADNVKQTSSTFGRPLGICSSQRYQTSSSQDCIMACCTSMGYVSILRIKRDLEDISSYEPHGKSNSPHISYTKGNFTNNDITTAMALDFDGMRLALGGRERESILLDVATGAVIWKAKNLPPNPQTLLQQPIWTTAMNFLSPTDTSPIAESTQLLATGTAYKQVRIYDVRINAILRRPILYTPEFDSEKLNLFQHRLTSICQVDSSSIVVGDAAGYIHALDLRKIHHNAKGRCTAASVGRFSGPAGSVREIVKHQQLPLITCVGLDRMLRTYHVGKRKQLDCVYLRQRLNCQLLCADERFSSPNVSEGRELHELSYVEDGDSYDEEDKVEDYVGSDEEGNYDDDDDHDDDDDSSEEMSDDYDT